MKKVVKTLCILLGLVLATLSRPAWAVGQSAYIAGSDTFSGTIDLTLSISGSASMGGACGGVCGLTGSLSYDGSKIELMSASGLQGFDFTQGATLVLYRSTGASDGGVLSLRFRNKGLSSGEATTVSVAGINITNGDQEIGIGSASKTIQYVQPQQQSQSNNSSDNASSRRASSGNTNSSKDDKTDDKDSDKNEDDEEPSDDISQKSSNAYLKQLTINVDGLEFDKDILVYDIVVDKNTNEIVIGAETEDAKATIDGTGEYKLAFGLNEYKITVKAEDGSEKEYIIKVYRDGANEVITEYENTINGLNATVIILSVVLAIGMVVAIVILVKQKITKNKNLAEAKLESVYPEAHQEAPNPLPETNNDNQQHPYA